MTVKKQQISKSIIPFFKKCRLLFNSEKNFAILISYRSKGMASCVQYCTTNVGVCASTFFLFGWGF